MVVLSPYQREAPVEAFSSSRCPGPSSPLSHGCDPLPVWGRLTRSQLSHPAHQWWKKKKKKTSLGVFALKKGTAEDEKYSRENCKLNISSYKHQPECSGPPWSASVPLISSLLNWFCGARPFSVIIATEDSYTQLKKIMVLHDFLLLKPPIIACDWPEVVVCSSHHHHAVVCPQPLSELLHAFHATLQRILANHKQHWGLHV